MPESEQERIDRAEAIATKRAREVARVEARLDDHEKQLRLITTSVERSARGLEALERTVNTLASSFEKNIAIVAARAQDVKAAADRQVSTRQFVLGLAVAVMSIAGLIIGVSHP